MQPVNPEHEPFHRDADALEAGLDDVRLSPADVGPLELIVTRPVVGERTLHDEAEVDTAVGIVGDTWIERGSRRTADGSADPQAQVTVMNIRAARLVAGTEDRVPLAGDQLYVDLDLSAENLPAGTLLEIGDAALEVTDAPHTGCAKFSERFGVEALRATAAPDGKQLRLRGINTAVVRPGVIRRGDTVRVVRP
ncbi:MOSC domain-containing protein [Longivirga aurantiaca]|uniref:MOSC domain-containing protein n=1 Tax=Longivirga aurantiaca TaxID=1837743 RepID=A0ABW1T2K7_9ACTN